MPQPTTFIPSTCQGCLSNCSARVAVRDGQVVGVEGNPASAATGGAVCRNVEIVREQAADPDRARLPRRHRGLP